MSSQNYPRAASKFGLRDAIVMAIAMGTGAVLRFNHLGARGLGWDEGVSITLVRLDWKNFILTTMLEEANQCFYHLPFPRSLPTDNSD